MLTNAIATIGSVIAYIHTLKSPAKTENLNTIWVCCGRFSKYLFIILAESPICLTENICKTGLAYSASFAASPDRSLNNLLDVPTRLSILAFQGSISDMPRESRLKWTQILPEMSGHACPMFVRVRVRVRGFRTCPCPNPCPCPKSWLCPSPCPSPRPKSKKISCPCPNPRPKLNFFTCPSPCPSPCPNSCPNLCPCPSLNLCPNLKLAERNNTYFLAAVWKKFPMHGADFFPREN